MGSNRRRIRDDPPDGDVRTAGGRSASPLGVPGDDLQLLIREQRRTTIRARTIAITLESALREQRALESVSDVRERIEMRREWCERALEMAQDVRAHVLRTRQAFELLSDRSRAVGPNTPARFEAADRQIEEYVERAERAARGAMARD